MLRCKEGGRIGWTAEEDMDEFVCVHEDGRSQWR